jgi:hypothetical protein
MRQGKVLWRKDDFSGRGRSFCLSSPIVAGGLFIAQLGGSITEDCWYDLTTGDRMEVDG